ncbi:MAG: NUDIX domain-containing protein [Patescibacteria group bacterium]
MKTFYVGVKGVIVQDGKVLILKKAGEAGMDFWEVPGGRIDDDETIEQALLRELSEELANIQNIEIHELLDAYRVHRDLEPDISLVLVFYRVTATFKGEPEISNEHSEYKWATQDEALELLQDSTKQALKRTISTNSATIL